MLKNRQFSIFAWVTALLLVTHGFAAHSQTDDKRGVFSQLPVAQQPHAKLKQQLGSARTYAQKQRIKKQLTGTSRAVANKPLVPGLSTKAQRGAATKRQTQGRTFGPRQRMRAQSKQRGGQVAQGGRPAQ